MDALSPAWAAYLRLQTISARHSVVDDYSYGLEAGLNRLLDLQSDPANSPLDVDDEVRRAVSSGRRAWRRHPQLALETEDDSSDDAQPSVPATAEDALDARQRLRRIFSLKDKSDRFILVATGFGHEGAALAARLNIKPAALRKRLDRLRDRLAA
jgi:hypothetical protein